MIQISSLKRDRVWFALAVNENNKMIACSFTEEGRRKAEIAVLDSISPRARYVHISASTISTKFHELYELYMGRGRVNPSSLDLSLVSPFRRKVYSQLCRIPRGRVTTYGRIAKKLGSRRYARSWDSEWKQPHATSHPLPQGRPLNLEGRQLWDARTKVLGRLSCKEGIAATRRREVQRQQGLQRISLVSQMITPISETSFSTA